MRRVWAGDLWLSMVAVLFALTFGAIMGLTPPPGGP